MNTVFHIAKACTGNVKSAFTVRNGTLFGFKISGEMKAEYNGGVRAVGKGTFFTFQLDREREVTDNGATVYFIADGTAVSMLTELYSVRDGFSVYAPECFESFLKMLELDHSDGGSAAEAMFLTHQILREADKAYKASEKVKKDTVAMIKEYFDARVTGKITLAELTNVFFLSRTQIYRLFKERYGVSPMQYHTEQKLERAKEMLKESDMRISDIADALSFSDAKYMSRLFKKYTGMLPKNYRKEIRNKFEN